MDVKMVQQISEQSKREKWPYQRTFDAFKEAGVASYRFNVVTGDTQYTGNDGTFLREPLPGLSPVKPAPALDEAALIAAIKHHQQDSTPIAAFRGDAAKAGVESWLVNMSARTCTYVGIDGSKHVENLPVMAGAEVRHA